MESNSTISAGETYRSEHDIGEAVSGRLYGCVFCKRGFTTAQALGGHMNIHRRDRAGRPKKRGPNSNDEENNVSISQGPRLIYGGIDGTRINHQTFFRGSTSDDQRNGFRVPFGGEEEKRRNGGEGDGLDLELRLGYAEV